MTRENMMEAMNGIGEHLIVEAAERLGFLNGSVAIAKAERRKGQGALSRFINSGWVVAAVCALVAVSVMGGIIWAGNQPGHQHPAGTHEETTAPFEIESENQDYIGDDQTEITVRHGSKAIYPRKFFVWSGPADGFGFKETLRQEGIDTPALTRVYYAKDGSISPCELILPENANLCGVSFYDDDMNETAIAYDGEFHYGSFLKDLPVGRHHVCLYVEYTEDGEAVSGADYAFTVIVVEKTEEISQDESESEQETAHPADLRYFQFPLTDPNDTASYVSLPDLSAEGYPKLAFFTPVGEENTLREVFTLPISTKGEQNILVLLCEGIIDPSYQTGSSYFMLYFVESTFVEEVDGTEQRTVQMRCGRVDFYDTPMPVPSGDSVSYTHYHVDKTASASVTYSEANRDRVLASNRHNNLSVLDQADELLFEYGKETYELTVLYSSMNGVETVHTPVESLPDFPYELFRTHALP